TWNYSWPLAMMTIAILVTPLILKWPYAGNQLKNSCSVLLTVPVSVHQAYMKSMLLRSEPGLVQDITTRFFARVVHQLKPDTKLNVIPSLSVPKAEILN